MPGYGLDQCLLRYRRVAAELAADEVWLGFLPYASLRTLSTYWPAMRHWASVVAFKPRFSLAPDGGLQLVPCPADSLQELVRLVETQADFLAAVAPRDHWVGRVRPAYAPAGSHWSHHLAAGRLFWTWADHRGRAPGPLLRDPESEVHRLVRAIVSTMAREVEAGGAARFRLLILPAEEDLADRAAHGGAYWDALVDGWSAEGLRVLDLSEPLLAAGALEDGGLWAPGGHYSARGHQVVADSLAAWLGLQ